MPTAHPKFLFEKDPWLLAEEIPDSDVFFFQIPMSAFCSDTSYPFLKNYTKVLTHYKKFHMDFYLGEKEADQTFFNLCQNAMLRLKQGASCFPKIGRTSNTLVNFLLTIFNCMSQISLDYFS